MIILVDMDGVICTEERTFERALARPIQGAREALEQLLRDGHEVIIYSARSWAELRMTQQWLADHRIPHSGIHLGKPVADLVIDDRAISFAAWPDVLRQVQSKGMGAPVSTRGEVDGMPPITREKVQLSGNSGGESQAQGVPE